jgi:hypothetical protein
MTVTEQTPDPPTEPGPLEIPPAPDEPTTPEPAEIPPEPETPFEPGPSYPEFPDTPEPIGPQLLDHDDFGMKQSKIINVIDSIDLGRVAGGRPLRAFPQPAPS